jgi:hypothetical protein
MVVFFTTVLKEKVACVGSRVVEGAEALGQRIPSASLVQGRCICGAARVELQDEPIIFFIDQRRVGEYRVQLAQGFLDVGLQNDYGELRLGALQDFSTPSRISGFSESSRPSAQDKSAICVLTIGLMER